MNRARRQVNRIPFAYPVAMALSLIALVSCMPASDSTPPASAPPPSAGLTATVTALPIASPTQLGTASPVPSATGLATRPPLPTAFITPPAAGQAALVPILMYHHLADLGSSATPLDHTWTVAPHNFEAQISWLAAQGFHTITFSQLAAFFKHGQPLPSRPVIITFDDGWREGYAIAFPVLRKYNYVGSFFVYPNVIDHSQSLTWAQLQEMSAAGMEIESHSLSHPHLKTMPAEEAYKEIADSRALLEKRLGKKVTTFNYPFGEYDSAIVDLVKRAGFESAVTISPGFKQRADELFSLHRNRVTYETTLQEFGKLLP